jgi:Leucine-rich repeat (LRR) protein
MKQSKNQPRTPRRLYMQECASQETMPEPLITRTTKGVKSDGGVSLKNYGMGDKQIVALSSALSVMPVKHLDLSGNRILTSKAAVAVLQKLDPHALEWLDISKNRISPDAIGVICNLLLETSRLTVLGLEESNVSNPNDNNRNDATPANYSQPSLVLQIRAAALQQLCESVSYRDVCPYTDVVIHECPLRQLNLAGNNIDDDGAQTIAQMVRKSKNLTTLDLSWNNIRRAGAVALFKAIGGEGGILQSLDIGYNAIGSTQDLEREAVKALARCINPEPNGCKWGPHEPSSGGRPHEPPAPVRASSGGRPHEPPAPVRARSGGRPQGGFGGSPPDSPRFCFC